MALVTVGRPGWWHQSVNAWKDLQSIMDAGPVESADLNAWRYYAMWGGVRLATDEPLRAATLLAAVALLAANGEIDQDEAVRHLKAAQELADLRKAHRPVDYLSEAASMLVSAGCLADPSRALSEIRSKLAFET